MVIVAMCLALLTDGVLAILRWGSLDVAVPPQPDEPPSISFGVRRYIWTISLIVWTAVSSALLVVGPGGRLAMRLLAVTAGRAAQGQLTEADEIVGRISADGTIGFFIFIGLFAGLVSALAYIALRRWLPSGRWAGLALGLLLLVVLGSRLEPLRSNNEDFDLVGPASIAIVIFCALAFVQGMAIVALAGRISRWLPLPDKRFTTWLPHVVLVLLIPTVIGAAVVIAAGLIAVPLSQTNVSKVLRSTLALRVGRAVLIVGTLVALPGFVSSLIDIAGRGP